MAGMMGKVFQQLDAWLTDVQPGSVLVEIGSDRFEGSTQALDDLAGRHGTRLLSVDVTNDAQQRLGSILGHTEFICATGSAWAREYDGPPIACLYLDNFDYIWDINRYHVQIHKQMQQYAARGQQMTNQNCQTEHMAQLIHLYPHLAETAIVMFDDTYCHNDCWVGKNGPGVVYLLAQGWRVVHETLDCGVILQR